MIDDEGDADGQHGYSAPLPPEDRLWRHPSELGAATGPAAERTAEQTSTTPHRRSTWGVAAASAAIGAVAAIGVLIAVGAGIDRGRPVEERRAPVATASDATQLATETLPAVVRLDVTRTDGGLVSGSGLLFRDDGHVLTTADLLAEAGQVSAVLHDGRVVTGRTVGADPENDIGVVDLDLEGAPTAVLGSPVALQPGEGAIVMSAAPGPGAAPFVARVVVTDLGQSVTLADGSALHGMLTLRGAIGVLAPGSVLLDQNGAVVAVATGRHPEDAVPAGSPAGPTVALTVQHDQSLPTSGTAWLTPVDFARDVATDIIDTGSAHHAWLGVTDGDAAIVQDGSVGDGAAVRSVIAGSPADAVGLRSGDVIVAIAGRRVRSGAELVVALRSLDPGDSVEIEYRRDGEVRRCRPTLGDGETAGSGG